ncbi:MAG: hypothetical protein OEZ39_07555 [Gammaproteobacteria bacterium]|nr:hypothetical protein [Gammaproteobacteria bacterium]MDH5651714.1 hypothetical protein [Gammaproteobacteria bacterium]
MKYYGIFACTLLLAVYCSAAQALEFADYRVSFWNTTGHTNWRHDASFLDSDFGVPTSELDYQHVDSRIVEINLSAKGSRDSRLSLSLGFGSINQGRLVDDDYFSASGAMSQGTGRTDAHRYSRTYSDIAGDNLFYLRGDFQPGIEVTDGIQLGLTASFWHEHYRARGLLQVECTDYTPPYGLGDSCPAVGTFNYADVDVISNRVMWFGAGISLDGGLEVAPRLWFTIKGVFYPLMTLNNEDIHHLRTTGLTALAQDPSIRMTGIGLGYDLELGLTYSFSDELKLTAGYRRWERRVKNQTITFYAPSGIGTNAKLLNFSTSRDGLTVGVELAF